MSWQLTNLTAPDGSTYQTLVSNGISWQSFVSVNRGKYPYWLVYDPNSDIIWNSTTDLTTIWPVGMEVVGVSVAPPANLNGNFVWYNGAITPVISLKQNPQIAMLSQACQDNIIAGFSTTLISPSGTITLSQTDQQNNQLGLTLAAQIIATATPWASGEVVAADSIRTYAGDYYVTFNGGTCGTTTPAFPSGFSVKVDDNGVLWEKYGWPVGTNYGITFVTPRQGVMLGSQGAAFIANCRIQFQNLKARVQALGTLPYWSASSPVASGGEIVDLSGNVYVSAAGGVTGTTSPTFSPSASAINDGSVVWTFEGTQTQLIQELSWTQVT